MSYMTHHGDNSSHTTMTDSQGLPTRDLTDHWSMSDVGTDDIHSLAYVHYLLEEHKQLLHDDCVPGESDGEYEHRMGYFYQMNHDNLCNCHERDHSEEYLVAITDALFERRFDDRAAYQQYCRQLHGDMCECDWDGAFDVAEEHVQVHTFAQDSQ